MTESINWSLGDDKNLKFSFMYDVSDDPLVTIANMKAAMYAGEELLAREWRVAEGHVQKTALLEKQVAFWKDLYESLLKQPDVRAVLEKRETVEICQEPS